MSVNIEFDRTCCQQTADHSCLDVVRWNDKCNHPGIKSQVRPIASEVNISEASWETCMFELKLGFILGQNIRRMHILLLKKITRIVPYVGKKTQNMDAY